MNNHEVFQQARQALQLTPPQLVEVFGHGGMDLSPEQVEAVATAEGCPDEVLEGFLDGLITHLRGPRPAGKKAPVRSPLTTNVVLKKLRIALNLQTPDVLRLLDVGGMPLTIKDVSPLFRKPGAKHYRPCDDEVLSAFLAGIAYEKGSTAQGS